MAFFWSIFLTLGAEPKFRKKRLGVFTQGISVPIYGKIRRSVVELSRPRRTAYGVRRTADGGRRTEQDDISPTDFVQRTKNI